MGKPEEADTAAALSWPQPQLESFFEAGIAYLLTGFTIGRNYEAVADKLAFRLRETSLFLKRHDEEKLRNATARQEKRQTEECFLVNHSCFRSVVERLLNLLGTIVDQVIRHEKHIWERSPIEVDV